MKYEIVNIVATANLNTRIDPPSVIDVLKTATTRVTYDPKRFPGIILNLRNGMAILLFRTGKMVIAGGRNIDDIKKAIKEILLALSSVIGNFPKKIEVQIQNIVATVKLDRGLNLEHLSTILENTLYIPEEFPGLIYRPDLGKPVMLMFSTGKIVIVGARTKDDIKEALEDLTRILK